jgi:hypothetical protein
MTIVFSRWFNIFSLSNASCSNKPPSPGTFQEEGTIPQALLPLIADGATQISNSISAVREQGQWIAEAFGCRTQTVENVRRRLVEHGFREALDRRSRRTPPVEKLLNGEQEARIIATRLGSLIQLGPVHG